MKTPGVLLKYMSDINIINARTHNLKSVSVRIPRNSLTVVTGLSGSGKSSLAFDTLYAEGQRRYVESLSTYARQFLDRLGKPDVERIDGLSPAISIEQHTSAGNPRSIVATVTEIHDYLRILYGSAATAMCPKCGKKVTRQSAEEIVDALFASVKQGKKRVLLLSPVVKGQKGAHEDVFSSARRNGFSRVRVDGEVLQIDEVKELDKKRRHNIEIVVDRLVLPCDRTRLTDSVELALKEGHGVISVLNADDQSDVMLFSELNACIDCSLSFEELKPRSFSFNSPFGACQKCAGLGQIYYFDEDLVVPDKSLPLRECIHPWRRAGHNAIMYYNALLEQIARQYKVSLSTPYEKLPPQFRYSLMHGFKDDLVLPWRNVDKPFEGVLAVLQKRLEEADDDKTREKYEGYRSYSTCPECGGARLNEFSRSAVFCGKTIVEVMAMSVENALKFFASVDTHPEKPDLSGLHDIHAEISRRLKFLADVGLDYLTLDRPSATLSGGEMQRIRLATQIGSSLTGVLYVLDEPTIGLHPRDNEKLINTLKDLRDRGNTLVVVEHDEEMMKASDYIVDLGPGAGVEGGEVVYQGSFDGLLKSNTLTAHYLSGAKKVSQKRSGIFKPQRDSFITLSGAAGHNLKNVTVKIPTGSFTVVTGVSGSGKSTLIDETLKRALMQRFYGSKEKPEPFKKLTGMELIDKVVEIDQSPIGRTPRSNPATYTGFFSEIRDLFAKTPSAKARGYTAGRFSFNVKGGRCEVCGGDGVRKIEMSFLPDVYVTCEQCGGKRFNSETLEVLYNGANIADVLEMSVSKACSFFSKVPSLKRRLELLCDVGLGYIALGQNATTLSGGEAQRIKLAHELSRKSTGKTLYLLDEPTTGLHFDDVAKLMKILLELRDQGNTIVVIEHNIDVISAADWMIDLGPGGGQNGGHLVYEGPVQGIKKCKESLTAPFI